MRFVARTLAAGKSALEEMGTTSVPHRAEEDANTLTRLRVELGAEAFDAAWVAGRSLTPDEAVALALGEVPS